MLKFITRMFLLFSLTISAAFAIGDVYDQAAFDKLNNTGESVLVFVHASWCPTCKAQSAALEELFAMPSYKKIHVLRLNFDTQKKELHVFKAKWQSTLIVFKGGKEVTRVTAETDKNAIEALLKQVI